jgi:DNA-binding NtrC family response regulator
VVSDSGGRKLWRITNYPGEARTLVASESNVVRSALLQTLTREGFHGIEVVGDLYSAAYELGSDHCRMYQTLIVDLDTSRASPSAFVDLVVNKRPDLRIIGITSSDTFPLRKNMYLMEKPLDFRVLCNILRMAVDRVPESRSFSESTVTIVETNCFEMHSFG